MQNAAKAGNARRKLPDPDSVLSPRVTRVAPQWQLPAPCLLPGRALRRAAAALLCLLPACELPASCCSAPLQRAPGSAVRGSRYRPSGHSAGDAAGTASKRHLKALIWRAVAGHSHQSGYLGYQLSQAQQLCQCPIKSDHPVVSHNELIFLLACCLWQPSGYFNLQTPAVKIRAGIFSACENHEVGYLHFFLGFPASPSQVKTACRKEIVSLLA